MAERVDNGPEALVKKLLLGSDVLCCFVAEADSGGLGGFQSVVRSRGLPDEVGDIGTFSRIG